LRIQCDHGHSSMAGTSKPKAPKNTTVDTANDIRPHAALLNREEPEAGSGIGLEAYVLIPRDADRNA